MTDTTPSKQHTNHHHSLKATEIREKYISYFDQNSNPPLSLSHFASTLGVGTSDLTHYYRSIRDIEQAVWADLFNNTLMRLQQSPDYQHFESTYEKLLAFFYTFIEELKPHRDFVAYSLKIPSFLAITPAPLKEAQDGFSGFAQAVVSEGIEIGEIQKRWMVSDHYGELLWYQVLFVLSFWANDQSEEYMNTDAAIEKASLFAFDLMGRTPADSLFDLAKFMIQR